MHALIDQQAIVVSDGGATILVASTDPTYPAVRRYLVDERGQDFDTVREMVDAIRVGVKSALNDAVAVVDGTDAGTGAGTYRIVHGDPVEEVILATALRLTQQDADLAPLGKFLKRLERNPSPASRSQLFQGAGLPAPKTSVSVSMSYDPPSQVAPPPVFHRSPGQVAFSVPVMVLS